MSDQPPQDLPPEEGRSITAHVTATGQTADYIRELAALTGRTPEAVAVQWAAGQVAVPGTSLADDPDVPDWPALFDGPADLSERVHEYLQGMGQ
ncbi:hypothetical protein ACJ6WD_38075 [Streptomyces sp. VTCC 41912]|uniref:hypothetical protein n=1 Tax=Streptomyces sp. VTCC 41912 TaxID=3383243 RepID=UPI003896BEE3